MRYVVNQNRLERPVDPTCLVKLHNRIDVHNFILALDLGHVTFAFAALSEKFKAHNDVKYLNTHVYFVHFFFAELFFLLWRRFLVQEICVFVFLRDAVFNHFL